MTITAKKKGTTAITASVGGYLAVCNVTVEDDYVTDVTITPAGPETLPVGKTRQLEAEVVYAHGTQGDQTVTWTTDNPKVATVTQKGLVTAVSEGTAEIVALSKEGSKNGTPVMETYQLTVTKQGASSADDVLSLSATTVTTSGGQYVDTVLKAPVVTIRSGATDVTDAYTLSYRWTDSAQKELGTQDTQLIQPVTLSDLTVTCTVTATSKTDSTQVLTGSCRYGVKVYPGTTVGAAHALTKGSVTLDKLMDLEGKQSILDQLLQGDGDSLLTPAIPGLTHVVFDMNSVTGAAAGTLSARGEVEYYLSREADGNHLADVSFTPLQAGTYGINFLAYGDQVYYGRLEVVVSGQAVEPPDGEDIPCDCTGYTFTGSDFFHSGDADPVAAVLFGKPSAGQLLRDLAHGRGGRPLLHQRRQRRRVPCLHPELPPGRRFLRPGDPSRDADHPVGQAGGGYPLLLCHQQNPLGAVYRCHGDHGGPLGGRRGGLCLPLRTGQRGGGDQVRPQLPHDPGPAGDGSVPGGRQPRGDGHHQL